MGVPHFTQFLIPLDIFEPHFPQKLISLYNVRFLALYTRSKGISGLSTVLNLWYYMMKFKNISNKLLQI